MDEVFPEIQATRFTLCDEQGRPRASLMMKDGAPTFVLGDGKQRVRISMSVDDNGDSRFLMADGNGEARIGLDCYDGEPSLFVRDGSGRLRIGMDYSTKHNIALITLADNEERTRLRLSCDADGARVTLSDSQGHPRIEARSHVDDHSISIMEQSGVVRTMLASDWLALFSPGKTRVISSDSEDDVSK